MPALLLTLLLAACALPVSAAVVHYDCSGELRSENLFDGGAPQAQALQARISVNSQADYVKRPPQLASGCLQKQVEVCGCQQTPESIRCSSLGMAPDGTEIAMDFSLDRRAYRLQVSGRQHQPKSGQVIETTGLLTCHAAEMP